LRGGIDGMQSPTPKVERGPGWIRHSPARLFSADLSPKVALASLAFLLSSPGPSGCKERLLLGCRRGFFRRLLG
jgi:hypothetical protein